MTTKAAFFDIDGTTLRWQLFHMFIEASVKARILPKIVSDLSKDHLEAFLTRDGSFVSFVSAAVEAYQGTEFERSLELGRMKNVRVMDVQHVAQRLMKRHGRRVHRFPRALLEATRRLKYYRAFISGTPHEVVGELAGYFQADGFLGTQHPHRHGFYTGGHPKVWVTDKSKAVDVLIEGKDVALVDSCAVGDSEGDIPMLERVGNPMCQNPTRGLIHVARERGWATIFEKKDWIMFMKGEPGKSPRVVTIDDVILDPALCEEMKRLLGPDVFISP